MVRCLNKWSLNCESNPPGSPSLGDLPSMPPPPSPAAQSFIILQHFLQPPQRNFRPGNPCGDQNKWLRSSKKSIFGIACFSCFPFSNIGFLPRFSLSLFLSLGEIKFSNSGEKKNLVFILAAKIASTKTDFYDRCLRLEGGGNKKKI